MRRAKRLYIVAAALFVAAIGLAATNFPSIVASRANLASYTSTVAGTLATAEVVEWGNIGFWRYSPTSTATPDGNTVIDPSDSPSSGRWLLQSGTISGIASWTACASGCTYTSPQSALSALGSFTFAAGAELHLSISAGSYAFTSAILTQPGENIYLDGAATTSHTVTSVVSSSGSAGAWSVVLQMGESVSNITASRDYVLVTAAANGTNPTRLDGLFPVTAVNTGSNQITVTDPNLASAAPSGAVTASVSDLSTVFNFTGSDGLDEWNGNVVMVIANIVLVGDGTAHNGYSVQDGDRLLVEGPIGAYDFGGAGFYVNYASIINGGALAASTNGKEGFYADAGGIIDVSSCWANGNTLQGILANQSSNVRCVTGSNAGGVATGNGGDGVASAGWATVSAASMAANDNGGYGYDLTGPSYIAVGTAAGNTSGSTNTLFPLSPGWTINASSNGAGYAAQLLTGSRTCTDNVFEVYNSSSTRGAYINACGDITAGKTFYVGSADTNLQIYRDSSNRMVFQTFSGDEIQFLGSHGEEFGSPTGGTEGAGTVNVQNGYFANGTAGATCSGTPTSSFASVGGIVTHC